ncbi:hypothetical protein G5714_010275 [Onychostoma macrolepis]|uniref:Uncharacterized protein n=1 Tax=Onychostoma macrolepis TaxID=369639 RepID=A0A7J6CU62_9TELE|nr:hypothetical protein G5714_010275 [Onychostoma macrolepis]
MGLSKAEAFFKNEEELEIIYPAEVKSAKDKKKMKEMILRENPETLLSDYSGPENNRKIKKAPEVKSQAEEEAGTTSVTITDPSSRTHGHTSTPASPKIKALRDNVAELEQDFFLFKEETNNNLHQLLNLTSVQQLQQLCSAVRHLEEDNQELRQELRRVREELTRREQHGHTLERRLEETRTQLHTIQQQQCVSTRPHSSPTTTTQHQRCVSSQTPSTSTNSAQQQRVSTQSRSSFTPATRQSPQAHQNLSSTQIHPPTTTSSSFTSNGREQERKDNIVILCDSNGHHLDPR